MVNSISLYLKNIEQFKNQAKATFFTIHY